MWGEVKSLPEKSYNAETVLGISQMKKVRLRDKLYGYEDGQESAVSHWKKGKRDGPSTKYYKNGQAREERHYKDGIAHGVETEWWENGHKRFEANIVDGKYMSALVWKPNGEKCDATNYNR